MRDWYVWSKKRPPGWNKGMVFPGVQKSVWTFDKAAREYYYHVFYDFQPDLNMDNPDVRAEIMRIMGYWLQLDVAGFRVDAVPFIIQDPPLVEPQARQAALRMAGGDAPLPAVALARCDPARRSERAAAGHHAVLRRGRRSGIQMMFNFFVNQHLFYALASEDAGPLAEALRATAKIPNTSQWAQFLRNHDELDLGRLSEKQRQAVFAALRARSARCSCTTAASAAAWRRCSAIAATWSWPTACCSRCPARR